MTKENWNEWRLKLIKKNEIKMLWNEIEKTNSFKKSIEKKQITLKRTNMGIWYKNQISMNEIEYK